MFLPTRYATESRLSTRSASLYLETSVSDTSLLERRTTMMRWKSSLAASLIALAISAPAPLQSQTTVGLRGGVTTSHASLDLDETFARDNRTGFAGGAFFDWNSGGLLGFQVAAEYVQKGVDLDFGRTVNELTLDYLEIPAVVKLGLPLGSLKPSAFGGVSLGFNTGCDVGGEAVPENGTDCGDEISGTEWSGVFGADLAWYVSSFSLWVDTRYYVGLSDISDGTAFNELKNRAWNLSAGVGFRLGG